MIFDDFMSNLWMITGFVVYIVFSRAAPDILRYYIAKQMLDEFHNDNSHVKLGEVAKVTNKAWRATRHVELSLRYYIPVIAFVVTVYEVYVLPA